MEMLPKYIVKPPFRFVEQYDYTFKTHSKKRWFNRKLIDIISSEFRSYPIEYYKEIINTGEMTVNGK